MTNPTPEQLLALAEWLELTAKHLDVVYQPDYANPGQTVPAIFLSETVFDWLPHKNLHDAWLLVEALQKRSWYYELFGDLAGRHGCNLLRGGGRKAATFDMKFSGYLDTAPEAITAAAIAVMEGENE